MLALDRSNQALTEAATIVRHLASRGPATTMMLVADLGYSRTGTERHLGQLRDLGLVTLEPPDWRWRWGSDDIYIPWGRLRPTHHRVLDVLRDGVPSSIPGLARRTGIAPGEVEPSVYALERCGWVVLTLRSKAPVRLSDAAARILGIPSCFGLGPRAEAAAR